MAGWQFLPGGGELTALPTTGWGLTRVPGYWTTRSDTLGSEGTEMSGYLGGPAPQPLLARFDIVLFWHDFGVELLTRVGLLVRQLVQVVCRRI